MKTRSWGSVRAGDRMKCDGSPALLLMAAVRNNAWFWEQLRHYLSGVALWFVQLRLEYGDDRPSEVNELSNAIWSGDWHRTRTLLFGYDSLKKVPGLREVIAAKFPKAQADDLRAILVETQTRAESGKAHYKEAHYEDGKIKKMTGDRNYELVPVDVLELRRRVDQVGVGRRLAS